MIYDIIEQKLVADGFVLGQDLFRSYMPAEVSVGVMTRIPLEGIRIDPEIPDFYRGQMQVITRHTDSTLGAALSAQVQRLLTVDGRRESYPASDERGEVVLHLFQPKTLPIFFPQLLGNAFEWSQHFTCVFGMKSL